MKCSHLYGILYICCSYFITDLKLDDCIAHATEIPENTKIKHAELMITHAFRLAFWRKQVLLKCVDEVDCRGDMVVRMCKVLAVPWSSHVCFSADNWWDNISLKYSSSPLSTHFQSSYCVKVRAFSQLSRRTRAKRLLRRLVQHCFRLQKKEE